jgi:hypothetical protein
MASSRRGVCPKRYVPLTFVLPSLEPELKSFVPHPGVRGWGDHALAVPYVSSGMKTEPGFAFQLGFRMMVAS